MKYILVTTSQTTLFLPLGSFYLYQNELGQGINLLAQDTTWKLSREDYDEVLRRVARAQG